MLRAIICLAVCLGISACGLTTARPKMEMTIAQVAILAAQKVNAQKNAPNLYRQAENYYLKAKASYRRKYFNKAKQYAILSTKYSEQAEAVASRKKALEDLE